MSTSTSKNASVRRLPKQKRSQQRVERILEAAAQVFAKVGYEGRNDSCDRIHLCYP